MVSVAAHSVEFRRVAKLVAIVVRHKRLNHWVGIVGTIDVGGSSTTATTARAVARTKGGPGDAFRCTGGALCFLNYIFLNIYLGPSRVNVRVRIKGDNLFGVRDFS